MQIFENRIRRDITNKQWSINNIKDSLKEDIKFAQKTFNSKKQYLQKLEKLTLETMKKVPENNTFIDVIARNLETPRKDVEACQQKVDEMRKELEVIKRLEGEMQRQLGIAQQQIVVIRRNLLQQNNVHQQQGLSTARIQKFQQFAADDSIVGERCSVCQDDIEVGRRMMRLDCHHVFCQGCVEGWLADHNTCPNCRHVFH